MLWGRIRIEPLNRDAGPHASIGVVKINPSRKRQHEYVHQCPSNLGWKLAGAVNGWAPEGLLDTYHAERYPVGERVMAQSLSQTALMAPRAEVTALRGLFGELIKEPAAAAHLAHTPAGSDIRYDVGDGHPLAGGAFASVVGSWHGRIETMLATSADVSAAAILIRPDGYVAWASDGTATADLDALQRAALRWFGPSRGILVSDQFHCRGE